MLQSTKSLILNLPMELSTLVASQKERDKTIFADEVQSIKMGIIQWIEVACLEVVDAISNL